MRYSALLLLVWLILLVIALLPPMVGPASVDVLHVRLTVDIAMLFYAIAAAGSLWASRATWRIGTPAVRWIRTAWTLAWLTYCIHVAFAFHHVHHWSHAEAVQHIEEQSGFGEGILMSYFFTLLWTADVIWWWLSPTDYHRRPLAVGWAIHTFMAFIMINGMIVFASGPARWFGVLMFSVLGILLVRALTGDDRGSSRP